MHRFDAIQESSKSYMNSVKMISVSVGLEFAIMVHILPVSIHGVIHNSSY